MISAQQEQAVVAAVPKALLIGGEWRAAATGRTFSVVEPSTASELCDVADASVADGLAALDAAVAVQPAWAAWPARDRGDILRRAFDRMVAQAEELALLVTLEMGKPLDESRGEVTYAAEFFRWFSEESVRIGGDYRATPDGSGRVLVLHQPVGPCVLITPWNFPLAMATRKIGPAIAAGCTMVVKPAEQTPLSMLVLAQILEEAGLPPGVLNVVTTSAPAALIEPLISDRRTRKLSFTGSTDVGRRLFGLAGDKVLRISLELGGNAAFLVFDDADLDAAVAGAMTAKMRNTGQACTAANRFYVAAELAGCFTERMASAMSALQVGRGTDEGTDVGPLVDAAQRARLTALVDDAVAQGAKALAGGGPIDRPGFFFEPTVLAGVPTDARILHEEIFGPVAPILPFDSEEDAVAAANGTEHGLVAYVYTSDVKRALRVVEQLETGMVGLNQGIVSNPAAPFGGVKHSGVGREGGRDGILEYLETKYVAVGL